MNDFTQGIVPPQDIEIEKAVLGELMINPGCMDMVVELLRPDSFYMEAHSVVYTTMVSQYNKSKPVDLLSLTSELRKIGKLDVVGGAYNLTTLTNKPSGYQIEHHTMVLTQLYVLRQLVSIGSEICKDAYRAEIDALEQLDLSEKKLQVVRDTLEGARKAQDFGTQINIEITAKKAAIKKGVSFSGISTGNSKLDKAIGGWQKSDLIIEAARPGMGKCFGIGTKIMMFDGSIKNVEDVLVGDKLMGNDSSPRNVLSLARGEEQMYWVHQNKAMSYKVNESHILSLKRSRTEWGHKNGDILNISVSEYLSRSNKFKTNYKGYKVAVSFPEQSVPLDPYFLGIWLGDGFSDCSRVVSKEDDNEIAQYLHEYCKINGFGFSIHKPKKGCNILSILRRPVVNGVTTPRQHLVSMGLLNNKHIPNDYLINSEKVRLDLLAGLLDTDGHYADKYCVFEITQKNKRLAYQIKYLCDTLGFTTSINAKTASIKKINYSCEVYRVRISGDIDKIPTRLKNKIARPSKCRRGIGHTGIKLIKDTVDSYYGFEIDGNKLFLLEDGTVVHNTTRALGFAKAAAVKGEPVLLFSLEMSAPQLVRKFIIEESNVFGKKYIENDLNQYDMTAIELAGSELSKLPIQIDDTASLNPMQLKAKVRKFIKKFGKIGLLVVDYIQLMKSHEKCSSREQEISSISRTLKAIAKEFDVPLIAMAQLSRDVEKRTGSKRPQLSDLRESGSIEQDADIVMFLYRPSYYFPYGKHPDNDYDTHKLEEVEYDRVSELIIEKFRGGKPKGIREYFDGNLSRFSENKNERNNYAAPVDSPFSEMGSQQDDMPF